MAGANGSQQEEKGHTRKKKIRRKGKYELSTYKNRQTDARAHIRIWPRIAVCVLACVCEFDCRMYATRAFNSCELWKNGENFVMSIIIIAKNSLPILQDSIPLILFHSLPLALSLSFSLSDTSTVTVLPLTSLSMCQSIAFCLFFYSFHAHILHPLPAARLRK